MEKGHAAPFEAEELIEYLPALRGLARALVRGDEVEDLVAATMLRAVERPPKHRGNLRAWLARTLRNLAVDRGRKQGTRRRTADTLEQQAASRELPPTPDAMLARSEALRLLHEMLDELGDPDRYLLFLRYFDGLNANEIGERLDILPATARTRLSAALGRLRARLRDRYGKDAFAPCFLIIEPLSRLVPVTTTTAGAATLGSYFTLKKVLLGLLPALLLLGAYLAWGDAQSNPQSDPEFAKLVEDTTELGERWNSHSLPSGVASEADRVPVTTGDPSRVTLVNESGDPLPEHHVQIYFRGKGFARLSDAGGGFDWPQEFQEGGLLLIWARGRVPAWHWREQSAEGKPIVVPTGRQLLVRAEYEDKKGAPQPHFSLDLSSWVPKPGSVGYEHREHLQGAVDKVLVDPASLYTPNHYAKVDAQNECRFIGLPDGEIELKLRSRSFDWQGARVARNWQSVMIADGQEFCLAKLQLRDAWTARIEAAGPVGRQAIERSAVEFSVQGSDRAEFWSPQTREDGGINVWIPHDPNFPEPIGAQGWEAELWTQWLGARIRWPVTLPLGGGDLGTLRIEEPAEVPAFVQDEQGRPIPGVKLRLRDELFLTDAQGRANLPIMVSADRELPDQVFLYAEADGYLSPDDVQTPIENGEIHLKLIARTGLRVVLSMRNAPDLEPVTATIRVASDDAQAEARDLPALYEEVLTDTERDVFLPLNSNVEFNRASKIAAVKGSLPLIAGGAPGIFDLLHLSPSGPVLLTVELAGVEVHREILPAWPHDQLLERRLEFERPETYRVQGILRDDAGNVVPGARISAHTASGARASAQSDVFGEFELAGLPSLSFTIGVQPTEPHWLRVPSRVLTLPDAQHRIELVAQRGKTIVVNFVDEAGLPVEVTSAVASDPSQEGDLIMGRKIAPNQVSLLAPPEGQLIVMVHHLGVQTQKTIELETDEFEFTLPSGVLVQVDWSAIELPEHAWLYLMAQPIDGAGNPVMLELTARAGSEPARDADVEPSSAEVEMLAGQYRMYLSLRDAGGGVWRQLSHAAPLKPVTIAPGTLQTLRFLPVE